MKNKNPKKSKNISFSKARKQYLKKIKKDKAWVLFGQIAIFVCFLGLWQLLADLGVIDPFFFSSPYAGPPVDGRFGRMAAVFVVADDAAEQTVIGSRYVIMVVQQDGCQGRNINLIFVGGRYIRCQCRIQGMYTFQYQNHVVINA